MNPLAFTFLLMLLSGVFALGVGMKFLYIGILVAVIVSVLMFAIAKKEMKEKNKTKNEKREIFLTTLLASIILIGLGCIPLAFVGKFAGLL